MLYTDFAMGLRFAFSSLNMLTEESLNMLVYNILLYA